MRSSLHNKEWYAQLEKPSFAPPSWLFAPVWTFLYLVMAVSFGYVWYEALYLRIPFVLVLPFMLNIGFNLLYTPIQFKLKNNYLASLDILLVLASLVWALVVIFPYFRWVSLVNIPYVLWVSFATVLQLTITWLNWGRNSQ